MANRTNNSPGGKAVSENKRHMSKIGKRGARTFWDRYRLAPIDIMGWAIVRKSDNKIVNFIGSHPAKRRSQ